MEDRHVAVMLEQIRNDFKAFGEGLTDVRQELREGLAEVRQELRDTKQELTKLMQGVLTILDRHDISIDDVEKRVARLEQRAG